MKKTLFQKLTALILALAMTMSMAGTVFAEELAQDSESDDAAAFGDVLPTEGDDEDAADADSTDVDSSETQDAVETDPEDGTDIEDGSAAPADSTDDPAASSDPADDPAAETDPADGTDPADASASADGSASAFSEEVLDAQSTDVQVGWNVTTITTATTYQFCTSVAADGTATYLKSGYYSLPAETKTVTSSDRTTEQTVTYKAGIYYFDANGNLAVETGSSTLVSVKADKKTAVYVLSSKNVSNYKTSYKTVTYSSTTDDTTGTITESYTVAASSTSKILAVSDSYTSAYAKSGTATVDPATAAAYVIHTGRVQNNVNLWCVNGELYSGFWRCAAATTANSKAGYDTRLYYIIKGVAKLYTGKFNSASATKLSMTAQYYCNGTKKSSLDGKVYKNGNLYTGIFISATAGNPDYGYYKNGVIQKSVSGWYYYNNKTGKWSTSPFKTSINKKKQIYGVINQVYYVKKGYAYHGVTKKIKSIGGGTSYYYTFKSNGQLVTNMFSYNSAYKKKKLKIVCSRKNHTCTIFAYNSKTKKYDIPCKSFVGAFAKLKSHYHPGTYTVRKKNMWFNDSQATGETNPKKWNWYKYSAHILGSGALFHTSNYKYKGNSNSMRAHLYNQLGTNVTYACIRVQCVNAKLIYNLCKTSKSIKAQLGYSDSNDAFGTMTLQYNFDQTGGVKVPSNDLTKDPTDT